MAADRKAAWPAKALALAVCVLPCQALAHRQAGLECLAPPSPDIGSAAVPTNALLFDFGPPILQGPQGAVPTLPAPPPWDFDARYRVTAAPLQANASYQMIYQLPGGASVGTFTTAAGPDTVPPTAPVALAHFPATDPDAYIACLADRLELIAILPSTDDQTPQAFLRYSVSDQLPDGGLSTLYAELSPVTFSDGGLALPLPMGLAGLPDGYVVRARDLAGNLSPPSASQAIDIGPTCDFAESTAGRGPPSILALALLGLWLLRPHTLRKLGRPR